MMYTYVRNEVSGGESVRYAEGYPLISYLWQFLSSTESNQLIFFVIFYLLFLPLHSLQVFTCPFVIYLWM